MTHWMPSRLTDGSLGGGRSGLFVYPKDDVAVVVLTKLQGAEPEAFIDKVAAVYCDNRPRPKGKP